jgi:phage baseplate assembly protein W
MKTTFTGFSTIGSTQRRSFKLYDVALIRQDLMNHFHTRIGERVMRPEYGCRIWDYLMEPFSPTIRSLCASEAQRICESDPRVTVAGIEISSLDHAIRVEITLDYKPDNVIGSFVIDFEIRQGASSEF